MMVSLQALENSSTSSSAVPAVVRDKYIIPRLSWPHGLTKAKPRSAAKRRRSRSLAQIFGCWLAHWPRQRRWSRRTACLNNDYVSAVESWLPRRHHDTKRQRPSARRSSAQKSSSANCQRASPRCAHMFAATYPHGRLRHDRQRRGLVSTSANDPKRTLREHPNGRERVCSGFAINRLTRLLPREA